MSLRPPLVHPSPMAPGAEPVNPAHGRGTASLRLALTEPAPGAWGHLGSAGGRPRKRQNRPSINAIATLPQSATSPAEPDGRTARRPCTGGRLRVVRAKSSEAPIEPLFTVDQVGEMVGLARDAIYRAIARGELEAFKPCGRLRVTKSGVREWLERTRVRPTSPIDLIPRGNPTVPERPKPDYSFRERVRRRREARVP
ncbi:MAG: helix-turn-helix domain-containing protein [Actinobacteria bacterium]|nr:MAG: helix-turn-helix domain-containing protein [Actinomycetota bacterium]